MYAISYHSKTKDNQTHRSRGERVDGMEWEGGTMDGSMGGWVGKNKKTYPVQKIRPMKRHGERVR